MAGQKIIFLEQKSIDKQKWDNVIAQSTNGIIYAWSWYLDVISPGWNALVAEDYSIVFPLTGKKKFGIDYLYPPFFSQQLGVFSKEAITDETVKKFIAAIPKKYKFLEINLNAENSFSDPNYLIRRNLTHHLSLNASIDAIQKNYSENLKRNLKKALQFNLPISNNMNADDLIALFRKNKGSEVETLKDQHYQILKKLFSILGEKGTIDFRSCSNSNGQLIAGAAFVKSHNKIIFLFSATGKEGREKFALPMLIDSFIRENSGKEIIFDFEGSNDANLARFYKSYGAKEVIYLQIKKNNLPPVLKIFKK